MEIERRTKQELKHLGFVRITAIHALVCVSNLYDYAKHNSGPLRSTVATVESAVTTVVSPVYHKFKDLPDDLLGFLDEKVLYIEFLSFWSYLDRQFFFLHIFLFSYIDHESIFFSNKRVELNLCLFQSLNLVESLNLSSSLIRFVN